MVRDGVVDAPQHLLLLNPDLPEVVQILFTPAFTVLSACVPTVFRRAFGYRTWGCVDSNMVIAIALAVMLIITAILVIIAPLSLKFVEMVHLTVVLSKLLANNLKASVQIIDELLVVLGLADDCRTHRSADVCERLLSKVDHCGSSTISEHALGTFQQTLNAWFLAGGCNIQSVGASKQQ